ncbi:MAG: asparagine synthetase B family protein [Steroidobacteraceae bacterium]
MATVLLQRLLEFGLAGLPDFDGGFAIAWYDGRCRRLTLARDPFGMEPLFYRLRGSRLEYASRALDLAGDDPSVPCLEGLAEYLTWCFLPGEHTLHEGVRSLLPGEAVSVGDEDLRIRREPWYQLSFSEHPNTDERAIAEHFRNLLEAAVVRSLDGGRLGAFISGGMDSSSVLSFARRHRPGVDLRTYSYRCSGESFDESPFARAMAAAAGSLHRELEFAEADASDIRSAVAAMDQPLCDIGLEQASWMVGAAAEGEVDVILTGDGGDEMWASHPVYAAQRMLRLYDRLPLPGWSRRAMTRVADALPDSDRKRDWRVKLKRFLPNPALPVELGPWRWRAYYTPVSLRSLLEPKFAEALGDVDPYRCVLGGLDGYQGPGDDLTVHLYGDYKRLVPFHFRRLGMLRRFGLEMRHPFYDRELVEFMARVPIRLKLEGVERTKRLFRMAMKDVLPDVINRRSDKLGLSIPLKNWLRSGSVLPGSLEVTCSEQAVRERGLFRPEAVARLLYEHRSRRHNHSHRIWAIHVLERWLQAREGRVSGV